MRRLQLAALVLGVLLALTGVVLNRLQIGANWTIAGHHIVRILMQLYNYAWFVGFFISGAVYIALMRRFRVNAK